MSDGKPRDDDDGPVVIQGPPDVIRPREFWIDVVPLGRSVSGRNLFACSDEQHERTNIAVIERRAYDALMAYAEKLAGALEQRPCDEVRNTEGSGMFSKHAPDCQKCETLKAFEKFKKEMGK